MVRGDKRREFTGSGPGVRVRVTPVGKGQRTRREVDVRSNRTGSGSSVLEDDERRAMPNGSVARPGREGLGDVVRAIASDLSLLVRQQIELAKQEVGETAKARARGAGALAAGAILVLFVVGFLGLSGAAALDLVLPRWAANLIVAGAYLALALVAVTLGRGWMKAPRGTTERTKETLREDVEWAKRQLRR